MNGTRECKVKKVLLDKVRGMNIESKDLKAVIAFVRASVTMIVEILHSARTISNPLINIFGLIEKSVEFVNLKVSVNLW